MSHFVSRNSLLRDLIPAPDHRLQTHIPVHGKQVIQDRTKFRSVHIFWSRQKAASHSLHSRHSLAGLEVQPAAATGKQSRRTAIPLLMSSGSTLHFSPDLRVAMMARTVELTRSGSRRKVRASVRCKKPPRTAKKSQHWHHRAKPASGQASLLQMPMKLQGTTTQEYKHTPLLPFYSHQNSWQLLCMLQGHVAKRKL